jgi:lipid II:glycine glycyltransferase (peptidoglycan interpeptide bridge formation enzyme)
MGIRKQSRCKSALERRVADYSDLLHNKQIATEQKNEEMAAEMDRKIQIASRDIYGTALHLGVQDEYDSFKRFYKKVPKKSSIIDRGRTVVETGPEDEIHDAP